MKYSTTVARAPSPAITANVEAAKCIKKDVGVHVCVCECVLFTIYVINRLCIHMVMVFVLHYIVRYPPYEGTHCVCVWLWASTYARWVSVYTFRGAKYRYVLSGVFQYFVRFNVAPVWIYIGDSREGIHCNTVTVRNVNCIMSEKQIN